MKRLKLLLVEDQELMCEGLRVLLEPQHRIVGIVRDGALVLPGIREHRPDMVLLDLDMSHRSGTEILAELAEAHPTLPVVVVTMHVDPIKADHALRHGARAIVSKEGSVEELRLAIREAMQGRRLSVDRRR